MEQNGSATGGGEHGDDGKGDGGRGRVCEKSAIPEKIGTIFAKIPNDSDNTSNFCSLISPAYCCNGVPLKRVFKKFSRGKAASPSLPDDENSFLNWEKGMGWGWGVGFEQAIANDCFGEPENVERFGKIESHQKKLPFSSI